MYEETQLNTEAILIAYIVIGLVFGLITMMIAKENRRFTLGGFFMGFLFGPLGMMVYMIMGESIEYRIEIEERTRHELRQAQGHKPS